MNFNFNLSLEVKSIFGAKGLVQSQIKRVQAKNKGALAIFGGALPHKKAKFRRRQAK